MTKSGSSSERNRKNIDSVNMPSSDKVMLSLDNLHSGSRSRSMSKDGENILSNKESVGDKEMKEMRDSRTVQEHCTNMFS